MSQKSLGSLYSKALACFATTLLTASLASAVEPEPAASPAQVPAPKEKTPEQKAAVDSLDARINNLQNTRDCINKAQSHQAAQACRANLKQNRKQLKKQ